MTDTPDTYTQHRPATADRPLTGLTILVVEDSRFASEAMRLLCLRSGARIRRADSLRAARRHLTVYRPSAVIVDLGLPDGSGLDLIGELARAHPPVGAVIAASGDTSLSDAAMQAGAQGFLEKPITSLDAFQHAILSCLPATDRPIGPRQLRGEYVVPDVLALREDLAQVADMVGTAADDKSLSYLAQFLAGVARTSGDNALENAAQGLADCRKNGLPFQTDLARIAGLVQDRLEGRRAV